MSPPRLTVIRRQPPCCRYGAPIGDCPAHDRWRTVRFVQPPPIPDDEEDNEA